MFVITPSTRISAILKNCPQALEAIISINPAFEKLRNPILRKLLAGRVTIKDAARVGKCSMQKFFNVLLPLGLRFEGFGEEAKGDKLIYSSFPEERKKDAVIIDVRRDLAAGRDPLDKIIEALNRLEEAELLCVINTFEPLPLLRIIGKRGFSFEVTVDQQDNVLSWIGRENGVILGKGAKINSLRQSSFDGRVSFFFERLQLLDVSKLNTFMKEFNESIANHDPFRQFEDWFRVVTEANLSVANAMTLSTVDRNNHPSARVVLLQSVVPEGFIFYTNYKSRKAKEIEQNPFCCVTFFWPELQQQVRIEGKLRKVDEETSEKYFMSRPYESRLGAWISPQSEIIPGRNVLEEGLETIIKEMKDKEVKRPLWWGGYILVPAHFEFWQERESRLHDRICYVKQKNGAWSMCRLAP